MNSRTMSYLLIRTLLFLTAAIAAFSWFGWSDMGYIATGLIGAAAVVQGGAVLWLRQQEKA